MPGVCLTYKTTLDWQWGTKKIILDSKIGQVFPTQANLNNSQSLNNEVEINILSDLLSLSFNEGDFNLGKWEMINNSKVSTVDEAHCYELGNVLNF